MSDNNPTFEIERLFTTAGRGTIYGLTVTKNGERHEFQIWVSEKGRSVRVYGEQDDAVTGIGGS